MSTDTPDYAERLRRKQTLWWKRLLHVQAPYHWNLRRQGLGRTLDVGCGIGRNLGVLPRGSVGVDHNTESVGLARSMGFEAYTVKEFLDGDLALAGGFDGLLVAHVIEHMPREQALNLLRDYLPFVRPGGRVFLVCPQERGYNSDPTHVWFAQDSDLTALARTLGLVPERSFSFPFPRRAGKLFIYNEFCVTARVPL
ncbi:MAG: methyltransferase domain-containing protein [Dermatophilaceae bacterium]